ncbi:unnamed protein product, partial [Urochloa humidicola]
LHPAFPFSPNSGAARIHGRLPVSSPPLLWRQIHPLLRFQASRCQRLRMVLKRLMRCCCIAKHTDDQDKINFGGGNVHVITSKENWDQKIEEANKDGKIVVVNFSASWCGPCRVISTVYSEMSQTYPQLMFLTVDVDELMDFSSSWDIRATPTFFFLKNGQQVDKLVGANKPELEKKVAALAGDGGSVAPDQP